MPRGSLARAPLAEFDVPKGGAGFSRETPGPSGHLEDFAPQCGCNRMQRGIPMQPFKNFVIAGQNIKNGKSCFAPQTYIPTTVISVRVVNTRLYRSWLVLVGVKCNTI